MQVEIDSASGFCFGVVRAIAAAERALAESGGRVWCLGDIVHNRLEVQRLERLGLQTISAEQMEQAAGGQMLVRAHGEPPATFERARALQIRVIDATCPVVAKLQERVKRAHEQMAACNGQVVILGKHGHAEVVGLTGQVAEPTLVIENEADLEQIDFSRPVYLLSQTTQSIELFRHLSEVMRSRMRAGASLTVQDTVCRQVSSREEHLQEFARRFDVVLFVCGRKSSNGRVLFEICRAANPHSYNVEDASELQADWFATAESVGVCGATSTPEWLMQKVATAAAAIKA